MWYPTDPFTGLDNSQSMQHLQHLFNTTLIKHATAAKISSRMAMMHALLLDILHRAGVEQ
jgi:hypothetical protein